MKLKGMIIILLVGLTFAAQKTKLNDVKIFTSGAYLAHETNVKLVKGKNNIVLGNLSFGIIDNSIEVSIEGNASILSVNKQFNYLTTAEKNPAIKKLEEKLKSLKVNLLELEDKNNVLLFEEKVIQDNTKVGGDRGTTVNSVKEMAKYVRTRIAQIFKERAKINSEIEKLKIEIKKIEKQLNETKQKYNRPFEELALDIYSNRNETVKVTVSYMIYNAGWLPQYDVRVKNINSAINLTMKAGIWQDSGLDWKNIDVTLSTNRPQNQTKPELYPWYIDFIEEQRRLKKSARIQRNEMHAMKAEAAPVAGQMADEAETKLYFEANENQLSMEYKPSIKIDVPSDRKKHFVEINNYKLDANYSYYSAPKINKDVFLLAKTTDLNKHSILPGQANVYFENSYVGNTYINPAITEKEYSFALGRDKNIVIERKQLKDFTEDKFLSSDVERFFGFELIIKNNRKDEINLVVEDNVPISKQEDIQVELIEKGNSSYDKKTGKLKWDIKIKAGNTYTNQYKYSVRYPKNRKIRNL